MTTYTSVATACCLKVRRSRCLTGCRRYREKSWWCSTRAAGQGAGLRVDARARIDIWTSNGPEALAFTGAADMSQALPMLNQHLQALLVVRDGPKGCWVGRGLRSSMSLIQGSGRGQQWRGDAHAGVFIAGLANGLKPVEAARRANAAAALAVTRWGQRPRPALLRSMH